jgi:hypothetical protein
MTHCRGWYAFRQLEARFTVASWFAVGAAAML